jgi:hypothetical protein
MYNLDWFKIVSQAMIDSLLRKNNYDSIISNFLFVDSSDDNIINSELLKRNTYNTNKRIFNNSRRVENMDADAVEAVIIIMIKHIINYKHISIIITI